MEHFAKMFERHPYICMMMVGSIGSSLAGIVKAAKTKTIVETTTHKLDEDAMNELVTMVKSYIENKVEN